jgi:uncharacterized protein
VPIYWKTSNFTVNPFDSRLGKLYDFALMSGQVPDFINPIRAAEGGYVVAGQLAFARMKRLLDVVNNREEAAEIELSFSMDGQGIANARGKVRANLELICQRCLEPMRLELDVDLCLGIVASEEEAQRLPEQYDPLIVHGEQLLIAEMVEEELFLALPAIPRHDSAECAVLDTGDKGQGGGEEPAEASTKPFAILAQLKAKH